MIARTALIGTALVAALVPVPPGMVERLYARGAYPALQAALSSAANLVPFAWFDLAVLALGGSVVAIARAAWRTGRGHGWRDRVPRARRKLESGSRSRERSR